MEEKEFEFLVTIGHLIESTEEALIRGQETVASIKAEIEDLRRVLEVLTDAHDQLVGAGVKDRDTRQGFFKRQADVRRAIRAEIQEFQDVLPRAESALETLRIGVVDYKDRRKRFLESVV
jgi:uncharacterized protein involved in exopolysaccharide biosynthesis